MTSQPRKACVDVHYQGLTAGSACVLFQDWTDAKPSSIHTALITQAAPYVPGEFFRRELPCIMAILDDVPTPLELVIVDGYVWLGEDEPGLGARLFDALGGTLPVIGVAKSRFLRATTAREVTRGYSSRPLFVTAIGVDVDIAADNIRRMHGPFRVPTLLQDVDRVSRSVLAVALGREEYARQG